MQDKIPCKTKWELFSLSSEPVSGDDLSAEGKEMKVRRDDERDRYNSAYFSVEKCQRQPAQWIPVRIELWTGTLGCSLSSPQRLSPSVDIRPL